MSASQPPGSSGVLVRIKGLPPRAQASEICDFLRPLALPGLTESSVHIVQKERRSAGEALVEVASLEDAQKACTLDREIFLPKYGDRYVRVLLVEDLTPADLRAGDGAVVAAKASRGGRRSNGEAETVAKVCGLPPGITLAELLQLFWGLQAKPGSTHITGENGSSVEAYVDFESGDHAQRAVVARNGTVMTTACGVFQLTVQRVSKAEWEGVLAARQRSDGILRLKGLPTKATAKDVLAFFTGFAVKKEGVHVQPQSENRHSKVAFVEFETPEEATRALSRDRQQFGEAFGDRYCLLQLVTRQEMEQARQQFNKVGSSSSSGSGNGNGNGVHASPSVAGPVGLGPVGLLSHPGMVMPGPGAGAFFSMPSMPSAAGMMPQAQAAMAAQLAAGGLPPAAVARAVGPTGFPVPPFGALGMGHGGLVPGHHPAALGAAGQLAAVGPLPAMAAGPGMGMDMAQGLSWGGPAAARYMVQDLSTGQRVFLDPRFNVSYNPSGLPDVGVAPWLQAQAQHSHSLSMSMSEPSSSQQAQQAAQQAFPRYAIPGFNGQVGLHLHWPMGVPAPSNLDGSGGSSNTGNGNGSGSGSGQGSDGQGSEEGQGSDGQGSGNGSDGSGSDGDGSSRRPGSTGGQDGSGEGSGTDQPPPPPSVHGGAYYPAASGSHAYAHAHAYAHGAHLAHHHHLQPMAASAGFPGFHQESGVAGQPHHHHHHHAHPHLHRAHPHHAHAHGAHHALKHSASRASTAQPGMQVDAEQLEPLQKRCRSTE